MNPTDHTVIDAAIAAKQLQQRKAGKGRPGPKPVSTANRVAAMCIWAAAAAALGLLIYTSRS